jgi:hypothetical protein
MPNAHPPPWEVPPRSLRPGVSGPGLRQLSRLAAREINIPALDISPNQFYS